MLARWGGVLAHAWAVFFPENSLKISDAVFPENSLKISDAVVTLGARVPFFFSLKILLKSPMLWSLSALVFLSLSPSLTPLALSPSMHHDFGIGRQW